MKKSIMLAMVLGLLVSGSAFAKEELGFRDLHLRMSTNDNPLAISQSYVDEDIIHVGIKCFDEKVQRIVVLVRPGSHDRFKESVYKKYGKPNSLKETTYQNSYGARWKGFIALWIINGDHVSLISRPYKNEMVITLILETPECVETEKKPDIKM